jgi:hypothetical protein
MTSPGGSRSNEPEEMWPLGAAEEEVQNEEDDSGQEEERQTTDERWKIPPCKPVSHPIRVLRKIYKGRKTEPELLRKVLLVEQGKQWGKCQSVATGAEGTPSIVPGVPNNQLRRPLDLVIVKEGNRWVIRERALTPSKSTTKSSSPLTRKRHSAVRNLSAALEAGPSMDATVPSVDV